MDEPTVLLTASTKGSSSGSRREGEMESGLPMFAAERGLVPTTAGATAGTSSGPRHVAQAGVILYHDGGNLG